MQSHYLYFFCSVALIFFTSCEKKLPTAIMAEEKPQIAFSEDKIPLDNGEYQYEQTICINIPGEDEYAYQLHTLGGDMPVGFMANNEGWLQFGNDIWTERKVLKACYISQNGKLRDMITGVTIRVRSADGSYSEIGSAFKSSRIIASRIGTNFQSGDNVSCGLEFNLHEVIGDIFVEGMYADHFMFRINILNASMQVVNPGTWYSSLQMADMRKVILNPGTTPALTPTPDDQYTQFECYVVSRQGIEEATSQSIIFRARGNYKPQAIIFPQTVAGLGAKHYTITHEDPMVDSELIPSAGTKRNRRLWPGNECMEAIWSEDFKLYLRWGYQGQYGEVTSSGAVIVTDNPWDSEINWILDASTNENYHSRIDSYDLRWDNAPFPSQSYFVNPRMVMHQDGTIWLRIKNINDAARHHTFSFLAPGMHQMEVCAVDLQNVTSDPEIQRINLVNYKPYHLRNGILIVDDDPNSNTYSPEAYVDAFYNAVTPQSFGPVHVMEAYNPDQTRNLLSPVVLQNYMALMWHSDNPAANSSQSYNIDALKIYLENEGNMVISGTHRLSSVLGEIASTGNDLLSHFGISSSADYGYVSSSPVSSNFFVQAEGISAPDIALDMEDPFSPIVEFRQGLSSVTYFNPGLNLEYLYQFGCKPVDSPTYPPTQAQYDFYSTRYVGYKYANGPSQVVVFGFPLSYMDQQDVQSGLQQVFLYMLGIIDKHGRKA